MEGIEHEELPVVWLEVGWLDPAHSVWGVVMEEVYGAEADKGALWPEDFGRGPPAGNGARWISGLACSDFFCVLR